MRRLLPSLSDAANERSTDATSNAACGANVLALAHATNARNTANAPKRVLASLVFAYHKQQSQ